MDGLASGELDIAAACPCTLVELGSFPRNTTIQAFAFSDLFQGYALMAPQRWTLRSPRRLRTYKEYRNYFSHTEAIKRIVKQIKGHRITHCKDSGVYTFLGRMFTEARCHDNDFDRIVVPEEATIDKLINGEADLQVGGVPSRLILERLGYRSIVTSEDIISAGMHFFNSDDYLAIIQAGWFSTEEYINKNSDTIIRMVGVNFRTIRLINEFPRFAACIQQSDISYISRQDLEIDEIVKAYTQYHPFITYEEQNGWFNDPDDTFNVLHVTQNIINYWKLNRGDDQKIVNAQDIIVAPQIYAQMSDLKEKCRRQLQYLLNKSIDSYARTQLFAACHLYETFQYLDCFRLLESVNADTA